MMVKAEFVIIEVKARGWSRVGEEEIIFIVIDKLGFGEISGKRSDLNIVCLRNGVIRIVDKLACINIRFQHGVDNRTRGRSGSKPMALQHKLE